MNQSITYISNSGFRYKYRCKVSLTIEYFRQWFQLPAGPIDIVQVLRDKTPLLPYPLLKTPDGSVAFAYDPGREIITLYFPFGYKTGEGQEIAARNSYRPRDPEIAKEYENSFAKVDLFTVDDVFGGWSRAQKEHFGEGGIFDQIYKN